MNTSRVTDNMAEIVQWIKLSQTYIVRVRYLDGHVENWILSANEWKAVKRTEVRAFDTQLYVTDNIK